ncbi:MAG: amidohydrolase [Candidatus Hermodarchaeota archaeon]
MLESHIIIKGGTLIDGTGEPPIPNCIIIVSGSKIVKVGLIGDLEIPKQSKIIDATGKTIIPSFIDSHTHFILMGVRTLTMLDLSKTESISDVMERVKTRLIGLPKDTWLSCHGWDESNWKEKRYPSKFDLDNVAPDNPVILTPYYGHLMVVNSRVLKLANITNDTPDPRGGKIDKDPRTNETTGVLREEAMEMIEAIKPPISKKTSLLGLQKACEIVLSHGCASIHELESDSIKISIYQTALEKGILKTRVYVMPEARFTETMLDGIEALGVRTGFGNDFLKIGAVKIYIDGSMGSRTAVFSEPYSDDYSTQGIFSISLEELEKRVLRVHRLGMQVAIHAIGDRGIEEALNAIEIALNQYPRKNHRHRIEHCEVLTEDQILRIKRLGVVTSVQPNFLGEWGQPRGMYEQRLGLTRLQLCNPYRKLLDEGIKVAFGSDCGYCPPWPFDPMYGIWAAVNHPIEENSISLEEAIQCYTLNGAYASFEENIKGSIEPGKLADITILSQDLTTIPSYEIKNIKAELTMINGQIQWKAN